VGSAGFAGSSAASATPWLKSPAIPIVRRALGSFRMLVSFRGGRNADVRGPISSKHASPNPRPIPCLATSSTKPSIIPHHAWAPRKGAAPCESATDMDNRILSELSARLAEMASTNPAKDLEKNFRAMLSGAFSRLDLVSREEYDVQSQVLARAREKLAALEA